MFDLYFYVEGILFIVWFIFFVQRVWLCGCVSRCFYKCVPTRLDGLILFIHSFVEIFDHFLCIFLLFPVLGRWALGNFKYLKQKIPIKLIILNRCHIKWQMNGKLDGIWLFSFHQTFRYEQWQRENFRSSNSFIPFPFFTAFNKRNEEKLKIYIIRNVFRELYRCASVCLRACVPTVSECAVFTCEWCKCFYNIIP